MAMAASSGTGMGGLVNSPQTIAGHVGVDLRGRQVGVAEELLHGSEVGSAFEQVGGVRVTERVRVERATVGEWVARQDTPCITWSERVTTTVHEHDVVGCVGGHKRIPTVVEPRQRASPPPVRRSAPDGPSIPCRAR